MEAFTQTSRQKADEECQRKKLELEQRLVPKMESHMDVEKNMQRIEEEARRQRLYKEDQINRRLHEIQSQKEIQEQKLLMDEQKRQKLEQVKSESKTR